MQVIVITTGYDDAQYLLGDCYRNGQGVIENDEEAFRWFLKAAEQGHSKAQSNVGYRYYYGDGVSEDEDKAKEWLRKSAEQGDELAIKWLHEWYNEGSGDSSPIPSDILDSIKTACELFMFMHENYEASYKLKNFFGILDEDVYLGHDDTLFKSGKNGFAITENGIYKTACELFMFMHENYEASYKLKNFFVILDEDVYLVHDDTLFKSGKNGFAITENGIYCREMFGSYTNYVSFEELGNVENIYINGSEIYADGKIIAYITGSSDDKEDLKDLFEEISMFASWI